MKKLIMIICLLLVSTMCYANDEKNKVSYLTPIGYTISDSHSGQVVIKIICVDGYKYLVTYSTGGYSINCHTTQMFRGRGMSAMPVRCED